MVGLRGFGTRTSKPSLVTSILEAQPQNLEAQPQNLEAQPQNFEAQPHSFEAQPQNFEPQPQHSNPMSSMLRSLSTAPAYAQPTQHPIA